MRHYPDVVLEVDPYGVVYRHTVIVADLKPDWVMVIWPYWMLRYRTQWVWENRTDFMAYSKPDWVAHNHPEWMVDNRIDYMIEHHPEKVREVLESRKGQEDKQ